MTYNRVLTDKDREELQGTMDLMQSLWPELYARKIYRSMVQFAWAYKTARDLFQGTPHPYTLSAGSHEDISTECLRVDGFVTVGIDPVVNCDLHTYALRTPCNIFDLVLSASVLEHTVNDEEFIGDSCALLRPGGYGIFTMDFKADWHPGERVPYTSNRFYTPHDLTTRLPFVLAQHNCALVDVPDYSDKDNFVYDGITYGFATFVFQKAK